MLDIKRIRTDFDAVAEKLATRGVDAAVLKSAKASEAAAVFSYSCQTNIKVSFLCFQTTLLLKRGQEVV